MGRQWETARETWPPPTLAAYAGSVRGREERSSSCSRFERIRDVDAKMHEVFFVAGRHGETVDACGCGDHSVSVDRAGFLRHHSGPFPETGAVHRYYRKR